MNLAKGFSDRNVAAGKTSFDLRWTNLMKANIHWDQDFSRIIWTPSLIGISNAAKFHAAIEAARQSYRIRKHSLDEFDSLRKAANPGKLKHHKDWIKWSRALNNYLSTIIYQYGVTLRYVIRECEAPDYVIESQPDYDFDQLSIN